MRLRDRVIVVTGASKGIGAESAALFARQGARVVLVARSASVLQDVEARLRGEGLQVWACQADCSDPNACEDVAAFTERTLGRIDGLFNNAGIGLADDSGILDTDYETWTRTLKANLDTVFLMSRAVVPAMVAGGGGAIVNNASMVAHIGSATPQIAYCASKGGVLSMTREMAIELADRHIRVNAVSPGPVSTDLHGEMIGNTPGYLDTRLPHMPMKRLGDVHEIATVAAFLMSDDASYITGQALVADGGITAAYTVHPR